MRTIKLTATQLASPDELNPSGLVYDRVFDVLIALDLNGESTVAGVPPIAMQMWAMWMLHGAVCNGGFFLYFDGHKGDGCRRAITMFETLGLWEHARIALLAFERWDPNGPKVDRRSNQLGEGGPFCDLDDNYWGLAEPMAAADAYVRQHPTAFVMCCQIPDSEQDQAAK